MLALMVGCGKASKRGDRSGDTPSAGENATGGTAGSDGQGGTAGSTTAGGEGGESPEGGAPGGGLGGTPMAGSGGSSISGAAGASGMAGAAGVSLPDGCATVSQHVGGTYCSTEMTCDTRLLSVSCAETSSEFWTCSCIGPDGRVDYDFPDATGVTTCNVAAKVCADPDILTADEECMRTRTMGVLGCAVHDTCDRLDVIDGVTLRSRRLWNSVCESCPNPGSTCCRCGDDNDTIDYRIRDANLSGGCDFLDALCTGENIDPVGAATCENLSENLYPDQACGVTARCGQPVELADGTRLSLSQELNTFCYARTEGYRCTCQDEGNVPVLSLDFGDTPVSLGPCRTTSSVCGKTEPLELIGSRRCTPNMDVVAEGGCIFYVDCVQDATAAGVAVTVFTTVGSQCENQGDGTFSCYCNNRRSGPYVIEAEDSATACPMAIEDVCPSLSPTL